MSRGHGVSDFPASTPFTGPLTSLYLLACAHLQASGSFHMWLRVSAGALGLSTPWRGLIHHVHVVGSVSDTVGQHGPWAGSKYVSIFSASGSVALDVRKD